MLSWSNSYEHSRLYMKQRRREADHWRLVKVATANRVSEPARLTDLLGHALVRLGCRLMQESRPIEATNAPLILHLPARQAELVTPTCVRC